MWRSIFLAFGIVLCILGAECLVMEKAVLASDSPPQAQQTASLFMSTSPQANNEIKPPDWAAWTLMSSGAVVILYSYSIKRQNG